MLLDSPTNNYAVLNPINKQDVVVLSDGNLVATYAASSNTGTALATVPFPETGKWYYEHTCGAVGSFDYFVGITALSDVNNDSVNFIVAGTDRAEYAYRYNGQKQIDGVLSSYGATYTAGDVIGVAYNADDAELTFYKNGVSQGVISSVAARLYSAFSQTYGGAVATLNFGQSPFAYTPPAGFLALNTANLPEPTISPALDDVPADYFNTVLWTGDGTTRNITGLGFQPDLTWVKARSSAQSHVLYDAVRGPGANKDLTTNSSAAEGATSGGLFGDVTAFLLDGFTVAPGSTSAAFVNLSGQTYVGWNWKAAGAGVANTDGTISSTVSANQKAGFSIVSYTGTGSAGTVGHGLGAAPKMVIAKIRNSADIWCVYTPMTGAGFYLQLQATAASIANTAVWNNTSPTSTVFSVAGSNATNGSGNDYIAYCFAEVEGYSKFGSYTGNGSTDGPFCWTGFRPAFVMFKRTDSTGEWMMVDDERQAFNSDTPYLDANSSAAESTASNEVDFLSNGFKLRSAGGRNNASGGTYIFAAFAEMPFRYSLAR